MEEGSEDVFLTPHATPRRTDDREETPRTTHVDDTHPNVQNITPLAVTPSGHAADHATSAALDIDSITLKLEEARRSSPRLQAARLSSTSSGESSVETNNLRQEGYRRQHNKKEVLKKADQSPAVDSKMSVEEFIKQEQDTKLPIEDVKKEVKKKQRKRKDSEEDIGALMSKLSIEENVGADKNSGSQTALVYDLDMTLHKNMFATHPERPKRVTEPMKLLEECKLLPRLRTVCSREVTREEVLTVHTAEHWDFLSTLSELSNRDIHRLASEHDSLYLCQNSFRAAKLSAGCLLALTDEVLSDRAVNGVAVIRPPGHHCLADKPMGFCLLGNVPIACKHAISNYGLERILVVDWDVHHGNGTQDMFYTDKHVLYVSLHRYDHGTFYPGTGHPQFVGAAQGLGYNVNIGWNEWKKGDGDYLRAFYDIILPIAMEYQPQVTFISAGFDSGLGDPLGQCCVSSEGYGMMTHHLMSVSKGKVILALEGGYNLTTVSRGIKACTSVLLGDQPDPVEPDESIPSQSAIESITTAGKYLCQYWKSLAQYKETGSEDNSSNTMARRDKNNTPTNGDEQLYTLSEALALLNMTPAAVAPSTPPPSHDNSCVTPPSHDTSCVTPLGYLCASEQSNDSESFATAPSTIDSGDGASVSPPCLSTPSVSTPSVSTAEELTQENRFMAELESQTSSKEPVRLTDDLFAVQPKIWCEHLAEHVGPAPDSLLATPPCNVCRDSTESWYCLKCYQAGCSRYVSEHALIHAVEETHLLSLSMSDLSVWCYGCDAYVHNQVLLDAKNKGHIAKFGEPAVS